jgi:hypothetical protein
VTLSELQDYTRWLVRRAGYWILIGWAVLTAFNVSPLSRDDSDAGSWGRRSGVAVRTDSMTGCQYLEGGRGGLTPRLDEAGRHICGKSMR